jgi:endonuclease-8
MDQDLFSGVGNIIKNEVLFRIKVHPEAQVGALPWQKRKQLIKEAAAYSWDFYKWKKVFQLSKHWLVYKKKECPRCNIPVSVRDTGKTRRKSYYCNNCQVKY